MGNTVEAPSGQGGSAVAKPKPVAEAREALRRAIPHAAEILVALLNAKDERLRLRAADSILARAGLVPSSPTDRYSDPALSERRDEREREREDPIELPCPKCAGSIRPSGAAAGTCPHCGVALRVTLVAGAATTPKP